MGFDAQWVTTVVTSIHRLVILRKTFALAFSLTLLLVAASSAEAHRLTVGGFNVESGGADIATLSKPVASRKDVDVWGLSELQGEVWAEALKKAVADASGASARAIVGTTGGADRLAVVFNETKLEYVRHFELRTVIARINVSSS